jgi:hypothetical protein
MKIREPEDQNRRCGGKEPVILMSKTQKKGDWSHERYVADLQI